jgi:hypothetical protein
MNQENNYYYNSNYFDIQVARHPILTNLFFLLVVCGHYKNNLHYQIKCQDCPYSSGIMPYFSIDPDCYISNDRNSQHCLR